MLQCEPKEKCLQQEVGVAHTTSNVTSKLTHRQPIAGWSNVISTTLTREVPSVPRAHGRVARLRSDSSTDS